MWFQDEARFGRISDLRRCWAPPRERPGVGHQVIREYLYALGAVCPAEGELCSLVMPWVDAETMSVFLAHLAAQHPDECGVMLLDGAGWHRAHDLRLPANLRLLFLPPYSPELNPVEHIWRHLRENDLGNRVFDSLEQVADAVCAALHRLMNQSDTVRSITNFDWFNTLCMTAN